MTLQADTDLLTRVARGDQLAFAALYDELAPKVYGLARRVLRDPAHAEEVAHEVMIEIWRTAPRFDPATGSVTGWVVAVAHRRAVDRVRSQSPAAERARRIAATSAETPYDQVADAASRSEGRQVRRCLGSLSRLQREALTLAYYGGHTYREVADLLGTALPTVTARMRDGLRRLRDELAGTP
jgi:RNA polymerase sigma-70 factor (ECF subfamily)